MSEEIPFEAALRQIREHPDYKVLTRLKEIDEYDTQPAVMPITLLVVDTETTGLSLQDDRLVELGMLEVEADAADGRILRISASYNGLEDPGMPISEEASRVSKLKDADVAGERLDDALVETLCARADLVIAHNAGFDRPMLEKRFPAFTRKAWACSSTQIPWRDFNFGAKQNYLAHEFGFFYEAHRALIDCRALVEILSRKPVPEGKTCLALLLEGAARRDINIHAISPPYGTHLLLKPKGYRWSDGEVLPGEKSWHCVRAEKDLDAEIDYLRKEIYKYRPGGVALIEIDPTNRFSSLPPVVKSRIAL